jgi:uncharacterized protein YndB with AHSA1/START domain
VPTVVRKRTVQAEPDRVWGIVSDPEHLPRWWPGVARVEDAQAEVWTKVFTSPRGRSLRADFTRVEADPPRRLVWRQEIEHSPFERFMTESLTTLELVPEAGATQVSIRIAQKLRGMARFGGFMVRRATRRQIDEALDGLARIA